MPVVTKKKTAPRPQNSENRGELLREAFSGKLNSWNCFHKNKNKTIPCRKLLLQLIKIHLVFPRYLAKYPNATQKQLETLWSSESTSTITSPPKSSSSNSRGSPKDLVFRCPRCKSTDLVHQGFADSTVICQSCGHNWQLIGGGRYGADRGPAAYASWQIPYTPSYVDSKGRVVNPPFPKLFIEQDQKQKYFIKSSQEIVDVFKSYNRQMNIGIYNALIRNSASILSNYIDSLKDQKGLPKSRKRKALLAVIVYYGNILSATGLTWEQLGKIFEVNVNVMDNIREKEMETFWSTSRGAAIAADLFPILMKNELPIVSPRDSSPDSRPDSRPGSSPGSDSSIENSDIFNTGGSVSPTKKTPTISRTKDLRDDDDDDDDDETQISSEDLINRVYDSLKKQNLTGLTKIGVKGFITKLKDKDLAPLIKESKMKKSQFNKLIATLDDWYEIHPSDLTKDILRFL